MLYLVIALGNLATTDWGNVTVGFMLAVLALGVLVGFAEELLCRGIMVVGMRGTFREVAVWLLTCGLFGVMHGLNVLQGQDVAPTVQQVIVAATQGSAFCLLRRYFGPSSWRWFCTAGGTCPSSSRTSPSLIGFLIWVAVPFAITGGYVTAKRTAAGRLEPYAKGATADPMSA